ncbi:MAG: oligosaccharide flippase family protein [Firmicutes bacterium]|nr:oligosaccharide flippase family protein [Alicyclobacillaceae bacterium]MCL6496403.1 oligosaccharide flippase family protein [Bacillota bacterium]
MARRPSIWRGTVTLTAAALTARGLGLIYRILLARFLGAEGLGTFQLIFPVYLLAITLAAAGTPVAVAQMVGEGRHPPGAVVRGGLWLSLAVTVPLTGALVALSPAIATQLFPSAHAAPVLWAMAPALPAVAVGAVLRGYFLGQQAMTWPAAAQVLEPLIRVAALAWMMEVIGSRTVEDGPTAAAALIPLGEFCSLALLATALWRSPWPRARERTPAPVRPLIRLAWPVTAGRILGSLTGVAQAALIPRLLQASGFSADQALAFFGQLTGMALPVIYFPSALSVALSHNLVPAVAEAQGRGHTEEVQRLTLRALTATAYWTVPLTVLLALVGPRLDQLLFQSRVPAAGFLPLVAGGAFLYFDVALAGVLRGLGRTDLPVRHELLASGAEFAVLFAVGGRPGHGVVGVALAIAIGFLAALLLDLRAVERLIGYAIPWRQVLTRPVLAAVPIPLAVAAGQTLAYHCHLAPTPTLLALLGIAAGGYAVALWATGVRLTRLI